jgi:hypothetical protein
MKLRVQGVLVMHIWPREHALLEINAELREKQKYCATLLYVYIHSAKYK